ncbi:hypothetical protein GCM10027449_26640 [Sinomonas notoginsengisoli]|uniref:DUF4190 domain-containing protein n=1 Tax=Sinomonas notoginsengisoli TaxID=1457311 RepID=UPI001F2D44D0|nr:DUF4190 domain-containing protein [Sinomonas notoginsengisoli]
MDGWSMDDERWRTYEVPDDTAPIPAAVPPRPDRAPSAHAPAAPQPQPAPEPAPERYAAAPTARYAAPVRTNPLAIASLVLAFFFTALSIVFGHVALGQIRRTGERGRGLALAGLWISYLSLAAVAATIAVVWTMVATAQNNATSTALEGAYGRGGGSAYTAPTPYSYGGSSQQRYSTTAPTGGEGVYAGPLPASPSAPAAGPGSVPLPASSVPVTRADRAYCQNRGVLLWLAQSATYRGALCYIDGSPTMISMSSDVGGNVSLPAQRTLTSFSATAKDGTVYTYSSSTVSIVTPAKAFSEPTTVWQPGTSSQLAAPGDLGLATPISYPACDGSAIVVYGTAWHDATNATEVQKLLDAHPGSSYLRTDLTCRDFRGPSTDNSGGAYVYAVYSTAPTPDSACRQVAGTGLYGRLLSNTREPGDNVLACG